MIIITRASTPSSALLLVVLLILEPLPVASGFLTLVAERIAFVTTTSSRGSKRRVYISSCRECKPHHRLTARKLQYLFQVSKLFQVLGEATCTNRKALAAQDNPTCTPIYMEWLHRHAPFIYELDLDNCSASCRNVPNWYQSPIQAMMQNLGLFLITCPSALSISEIICLTDAGSSMRPRSTTS